MLRDVTERVVIASKGRFDRAGRGHRTGTYRAPPPRVRLTSDEFMEATLDVWNIAPESARRVRHPAPFPVELPERLIQLYTYAGDLVLDPFMGSGSTLVAAARTGRRYVGYDLDESYVAIARERVATAGARGTGSTAGVRPAAGRGAAPGRKTGRRTRVEVAEVGEVVEAADVADEARRQAAAHGKAAPAIAERIVTLAGFTVRARNQRLAKLGVSVGLVATDAAERPWYFDVTGAFTTTGGGLLRSDAVWRALGRAHVLRQHKYAPVVLLTSHLPRARSEGDHALRAAGPEAFYDAVEMLSEAGQARLAAYAAGGAGERALPGFWSAAELGDG